MEQQTGVCDGERGHARETAEEVRAQAVWIRRPAEFPDLFFQVVQATRREPCWRLTTEEGTTGYERTLHIGSASVRFADPLPHAPKARYVVFVRAGGRPAATFRDAHQLTQAERQRLRAGWKAMPTIAPIISFAPRWTGFFGEAVQAYNETEEALDAEPNESDVADHMGIGRTSLWRKLKPRTFDDVRRAAKSGTDETGIE